MLPTPFRRTEPAGGALEILHGSVLEERVVGPDGLVILETQPDGLHAGGVRETHPWRGK